MRTVNVFTILYIEGGRLSQPRYCSCRKGAAACAHDMRDNS